MKSFSKLIRLVLCTLLAMPLAVQAQGAVQFVYESPDGARYQRGGESYSVEAGAILREGDRIATGNSTVIFSLGNGSLITVYPNSLLTIDSLVAPISLTLNQGEILGDNAAGSPIQVGTVAGTVKVSAGVFGVLASNMGTSSSVQVRNLDGTVSFRGAPDLDTSGSVVTLLEPNKEVMVPPGEELIVRGIYNEDSEVFAVAREGVALAVLSPAAVGEIREAVEVMSSVTLPESVEAPAVPPTIIEIPVEDVDTASDKG